MQEELTDTGEIYSIVIRRAFNHFRLSNAMLLQVSSGMIAWLFYYALLIR